MPVVPITRELLSEFYDKHPRKPISSNVGRYITLAGALSQSLTDQLPEPPFPFPYKLDDCLWRSRHLCEAIIANFVRILKQCDVDEVARLLQSCWDKLASTEEFIRASQKSNSDQISQQITGFMPKDFRSGILKRRAEKKEKKREHEVQKLVKQKASVGDKYALLLKHQMERREALANLGACKGVFRFLVRHVVGVPKVLLDFAKEINAKLGPMEEQRVRFGPDFYEITRLGVEIWILTGVWASHYEEVAKDPTEPMNILENAVMVYAKEVQDIVKMMADLFKISPWFVSSDEIKSVEIKGGDENGNAAGKDLEMDDESEEIDSKLSDSEASSVMINNQ